MMHSELVESQKIYLSQSSFSSIALVNSFSDIFFTPNWSWPEEYKIPRQKKNEKNTAKSLSCKKQIAKWFESLSLSEKISILIIKDSDFIYRFLQMLRSNDPSRLFCIQNGKSLRNYQQVSDDNLGAKGMQQLLRFMQVAFLSEPILYFSKESQDFFSQQLLRWMNFVSNDKIFESYNKKNKKSQKVENNILWYCSSSFHPLEVFLVNELEKAIIQRFETKQKSEIAYLSDLIKFAQSQKLKNKADLQECLFYLKTPLQSALTYSTQQIKEIVRKLEVLEELYQFEKEQIINKIIEQQQIEVQQSSKKKRKRRRKRKRAQTEEEILQKENQEEVLQKNTEIQKMHQNSEMHQHSDVSFQPIASLDEKIKFQDQISLIQKDSDQSDLHETNVTIQKYFKNQNILSESNIPEITSFQKNLECQDVSSLLQQNQNINSVSNSFEYSERSSLAFQVQDQEYLPINNQSVKNLVKKKKSKKEKQIQVIFKEVIKEIRNDAFSEFINNISIQSNNLYHYKISAYQFIAFFISSLLPQTDIRLFGSNAVGLSLANSDIDIMLGNIKWTSLQSAKQVLYQLGSEVTKMGWVIDSQIILEAKVPVLKLYIDPKIQYFDMSPLKYASSTVLTQSIVIKADIIINIQGDQHIGCESTSLMKDWLLQHPMLQRIVLFFKYIIWFYGFNQNYKGGICSYCIFLMVLAYLLKSDKQKGTSAFENGKRQIELSQHEQGVYILQILKFYGMEFNPQIDEIRLQDETIYESKQKQEQRFSPNRSSMFGSRPKNLKIVDPINKKQIQSSFSKFQQVQCLFRSIYTETLNKDQLLEKELTTIQDFLQDIQRLSTHPPKSLLEKNERNKKLVKKIISKIKKSKIVKQYSIKDAVGVRAKIQIQKWDKDNISQNTQSN